MPPEASAHVYDLRENEEYNLKHMMHFWNVCWEWDDPRTLCFLCFKWNNWKHSQRWENKKKRLVNLFYVQLDLCMQRNSFIEEKKS